ncbi:hypothetical protein J3R83DRAFT_6518 [Lanmaoa asiatica]|nr:hypothetical protein J3R83DRAFT_6518 [Lanmaoa asiatica]
MPRAVELEGRPKLVRTLKSSGALVVSNAKEAAIILVDSTTESGKRLIRTWGHDASKVVLEHTWARVSIDVGRPLLEADNWGGAMTIDDGKPVTIDGVVVDEDELEEVEALVTKSPLPTPRVTPVDPTSQRPDEHLDITRSESNTSAPHVRGPPPPGPPIAQPVAPTQSQNTYAYAPFTAQQAYPSSQSQVMPTQPFPHTGFPSSHLQTIHASSVPHTPLPSVQSQMMQMTPNTTSINGVNFQTPNLATIMTIMEVVRHMDQSTWFGQNQMPVSQPPANSNTSTFSVQSPATREPIPSTSGGLESLGLDPSLSSSQDHLLSDSATSSRKYGSGTEFSEDRLMTRNSRPKPSRRPPDEILTPLISRKRPPVVKPTNPPPKRLRKGKEKAISTDSSEHSEVDELMEVSDGPYSTHSSASPPAPPRNIIARKKHGEIFLSGSGQPLRFFVQVDLHGRHTVVTNIKKNKGKIVNNIADADYLILFARSDTFQGLLNEAIALGKSPILAAFVADCVEEGALLDETDYVLESVAKVKALRRGRQSAFSIKVETPETLAHQTRVVKPKSSPATGEGKKSRGTPSKSSTNKKSKAPKSAPSKPTAEEGGDSMASRSPTPPPVSTRRLMKNGKYLFTEVEDEYFLRLAKHHLTRDPTISNTTLVHKQHKKMPHHSGASWGAHIDKKLKGALEDVRKRANIANRKRVNEAVNKNSSQGFVNEGMPSKGRTLGTAEGIGDTLLNSSHPSQEDLEQQDFDVITQFFASGGGDDDDDERVWQELEKHRQCRSASSWPDYYAAHEKQVYARIEELMNQRAGD